MLSDRFNNERAFAVQISIFTTFGIILHSNLLHRCRRFALSVWLDQLETRSHP